jgi:hypothetical protein
VLTETVRNELAPGSNILFEACNDYHCARVSFTSPQMVEDLARYNVVPRKSHTYSWPDALPPELANSFLLGVLDGDGWIIPDKRKAKPYYVIGIISGNPIFPGQIARVIEDATSISSPQVCHVGRAWSIRYGGRRAEVVSEWLHRDLPGLARKRLPPELNLRERSATYIATPLRGRVQNSGGDWIYEREFEELSRRRFEGWRWVAAGTEEAGVSGAATIADTGGTSASGTAASPLGAIDEAEAALPFGANEETVVCMERTNSARSAISAEWARALAAICSSTIRSSSYIRSTSVSLFSPTVSLCAVSFSMRVDWAWSRIAPTLAAIRSTGAAKAASALMAKLRKTKG